MTCDRETCWCCGNGHTCEPPHYPKTLGETWTCPECGGEYRAFEPHAEYPPDHIVLRHVPEGTIGWTTGTGHGAAIGGARGDMGTEVAPGSTEQNLSRQNRTNGGTS